MTTTYRQNVAWIRVCGVALLAALAGCPSNDEESAADGGAENEDGMPRCKPGSKQDVCVDEIGLKMCPLDTGWPGDELHPCEEENTIVLHYGPKDYDDPKEVAKYTMPPQSEVENCVFVQAPNDKEVYLGSFYGRMRPNSHHLIVTTWDALPDGVKLGEPVECSQFSGLGARWLLGSQDPEINLARGGAVREAGPAKKGDPDYGLGTRLPPKQYLRIDMHYINATDKEILRESWVKLELVPKEDVTTKVDMITFFQGSISIPPRAKGVKTGIAKCEVPSDRYVSLVTGHFHEYGTRFSVWHTPAGGKEKLIYETYDWEDPGNAYYADRQKNPDPDREVNQWGAHSGYLPVKKGDIISFQCEFDNPSDQTVTLGELGRDQMCNVFGMYFPTDGDVWSCQCVGDFCF